MFKNDKVIVADAHQYLIDHFQEFDFIWSSPPCPTHSRMRKAQKKKFYPDMRLYQEILLLQHFFKGKFCIENVIPYYNALILPTIELSRHSFWSNFKISPLYDIKSVSVSKATKEELSEYHGIELPKAKNQRLLLRNCVYPELGKHIFEEMKNVA
jgi:DNA (cytosine-5)-methyltransferase 1